jgi:hypothetical protein
VKPALVVFRLVERLVNRALRSLRIFSQHPDLKLRIVALVHATDYWAEKSRANRSPHIQVLSKMYWNLRLLQCGKDWLQFGLATLPYDCYGLPLSFFLCRNKNDVAIAAFREAVPKFRFA